MVIDLYVFITSWRLETLASVGWGVPSTVCVKVAVGAVRGLDSAATDRSDHVN